MAVPEKLMKYKFHFMFSTLVLLLILSLFLIAPRFLTILSYFWPLFMSTALFLFAVLFFGRTSPLVSEISSDKPGEGLLDYVAGQPEELIQKEQEQEEEK
ncbi:hypothetical protein IFM89_025433 [Coptis chinensis]|uniref:Transmembrane protein n=1 Tax=Coptis chinensis TaxID=261450 RepID=A0A835M1P0_9MAGN|nr:hypothetical protein IFM89_025433 [Coptis chinensis]